MHTGDLSARVTLEFNKNYVIMKKTNILAPKQ